MKFFMAPDVVKKSAVMLGFKQMSVWPFKILQQQLWKALKSNFINKLIDLQLINKCYLINKHLQHSFILHAPWKLMKLCQKYLLWSWLAATKLLFLGSTHNKNIRKTYFMTHTQKKKSTIKTYSM